MTPWLDDGDVRLHHGDALEQLREMPSESVQCIVTSPPFFALRDYGVEGQIGLEESPQAWCDALVAVFREARRVLRSDGVAWIECGDTYASSPASGGERIARPGDKNPGVHQRTGGVEWRQPADCKPKDLVGAPWLLAFALRADGWYLRSDTIWARPNPMPESVTDRPTKAHSYVFLLAKSDRYFYDGDAIREPAVNDPKAGGRQAAAARGEAQNADFQGATPSHETRSRNLNGPALRATANARSVWSIATEPTPFAHFATFPQALVERCIKAGTSELGACPECGAPWRRVVERTAMVVTPTAKRAAWQATDDHARTQVGGTMTKPPTSVTTGWEPSCGHGREPVPCVVLDPFMGSATTGLVARRLGRHAVGIELNESYLAIAAERLQQLSLLGGSA